MVIRPDRQPDRVERRGFASLSPERRREIASRGGKVAHQNGTAHQWTVEEAKAAGRKGGIISRGGRGKLPTPTPADQSDVQAPVSSREDNDEDGLIW